MRNMYASEKENELLAWGRARKVEEGKKRPETLSPNVLNRILSTVTSILQSPSSLFFGPDSILSHTGNTKKILFGTKRDADATALRTRTEALEKLLVVVKVVVLNR